MLFSISIPYLASDGLGIVILGGASVLDRLRHHSDAVSRVVACQNTFLCLLSLPHVGSSDWRLPFLKEKVKRVVLPLTPIGVNPNYCEGVSTKIIIDLEEFNMAANENKPGNKMAGANQNAPARRGPEKEANAIARVSKKLLLSDKEVFSVSFPNDQSLNEMTQELKRFLINAALRRSGGKRQGAARLLGISRYSLKHYMKTLGYDGE